MVEYYVAPDGVYTNAGTSDAPTTLEGARDKNRAITQHPVGGITWIFAHSDPTSYLRSIQRENIPKCTQMSFQEWVQ